MNMFNEVVKGNKEGRVHKRRGIQNKIFFCRLWGLNPRALSAVMV